MVSIFIYITEVMRISPINLSKLMGLMMFYILLCFIVDTSSFLSNKKYGKFSLLFYDLKSTDKDIKEAIIRNVI